MKSVAVAVAVAVALAVAVAGVARADTGSAVLVQPPLEAGAPEVSAAASPSVVRLGAQLTLFVTVTFDPGVEVNLREPVELGPAFEVRTRDSRDRDGPNGKRVREYQLAVFAWEVGDLQLPPVAVTFTLAGHAGQVATNAVPVRVESMLGAVQDDPRPRADEPPAELTARDWFWLAVASGVGGLVLAGGGGLVWARRRRAPIQLAPARQLARRLDLPGERALALLLAIERSGVLDREDTRKAGYAQMVAAIRAYVGARYRVATADLTSAELVRALAPVAPVTERLHVEAWLERCDVVKYGGLRATTAEGRSVLGAARTLVVETTATEAPAAAPAEVAA